MLTEKQIGKRIRAARLKKQLTMSELVEALNGSVSASKICRLENGKHEFQETEDLLAICEVLGIPKEEILG